MAVYKISVDLRTPGWETLFFENMTDDESGELSLSFFPQHITERHWVAPRLKEGWLSPWVRYSAPSVVNDYPCIALQIPAFSKRARIALQPLIGDAGEFLPLRSVDQTGTYWAFNVTKVADALDETASEIEWYGTDRLRMKRDPAYRPTLARVISRYVFKPDLVRDLSMFRLTQQTTRFYVTQKFVDVVNANDLKGFQFLKVWETEDA